MTGDPARRVRFYRRYGSMLLPIPYAQPSRRPGMPRVENMLLITIPSAIGPTPDLDGELIAAFSRGVLPRLRRRHRRSRTGVPRDTVDRPQRGGPCRAGAA